VRCHKKFAAAVADHCRLNGSITIPDVVQIHTQYRIELLSPCDVVRSVYDTEHNRRVIVNEIFYAWLFIDRCFHLIAGGDAASYPPIRKRYRFEAHCLVMPLVMQTGIGSHRSGKYVLVPYFEPAAYLFPNPRVIQAIPRYSATGFITDNITRLTTIMKMIDDDPRVDIAAAQEFATLTMVEILS
jgi:hypothetical protein